MITNSNNSKEGIAASEHQPVLVLSASVSSISSIIAGVIREISNVPMI